VTPIPTPAPTGDATNAKAVIVLMSDGANNAGRDPLDAADRAKAQGIPIFTIALGTPNGIAEVKDEFGRLRRIPVPPDPGTLQQIAEITGAQFFDAPNADQLKAIYKSLGQAIGSEETTRDISVWFLAAGVIGVAAAGGLSLLWFNRFP
jgi:Ca-activated chloride channel family protein